MSTSESASEATGFPISQQQRYVFVAFSSVTFWTSIELVILCLATFKRYKGVYFWSLLLSSCSISVNTLGFIFFFFVRVTPYFSVTLILLGWYFMVTGHSVVLWSRLHFVLQQPTLLRAILYLIIANAICMHIPVTVLLYGAVLPSLDIQTRIRTGGFSTGYNIMERIQLVVFCLQEWLLSMIYIYETYKLLRIRPQQPTHAHKVILTQLIVINIVLLFLDIVVVVFEYAGLFWLQVVFKPVAYAVKLRLEYAILGRLVEVATTGGSNRSSVQGCATVGGSWPGDYHRANSSSPSSPSARRDPLDEAGRGLWIH